MPYCIHCGKENPGEAKFCAGCGKPIGASEPSGQRKQVYDGVIHKCPNCGEILDSFITRCPSCGYEIRDTKSSKTVNDLAEKIDRISASKHETGWQRFWREFNSDIHKTDKQKIELIKGYVIPTTKEDVLEFMTYAMGNINTAILADDSSEDRVKTERAICEAWIAKLDQAYSKAVVLFGNDPAFYSVQQMYLQKKEEIRKADRVRSWKNSWPFLIFIALFAMITIILIFGNKGGGS